MATKTRTKSTHAGILPPLKADDAGRGDEPVFHDQPSTESRKLALVKALAWYSASFGRKNAKDWLLHFAQDRGVTSSDLKVLKTVHERSFDLQIGALARLSGRGLQLTEAELAVIGDHLKSLLQSTAVETPDVSADEAEVKNNRPNVQEIMRDRAREAAGELEGMFDAFLLDGTPDSGELNVVALLTQHGIMAQHVPLITEVWTRRKAEYEAVLDKADAQLVEGYAQYGRVAMKNLVKWCDAVLAGLASYTTVKKAAKTPRKRKPVSPEKLTAKTKYLKTFKDDTFKLDLTSLHPSKLVGASEAFLFDTAKRKLVYVVADSHTASLSVKGTTLLGFDAKASGIKTVRKPGDTIKKLAAAGKPASRKVFSELTTAHAQWNGRTNENMIIIKAW